MDHAEAFLTDQMPLGLRPVIPATLKIAYEQPPPFLSTASQFSR